MKRWAFGFVVFLFTLGIGTAVAVFFVFVPNAEKTSSEPPPQLVEIAASEPSKDDFVAEFRDLPSYEILDFPELRDNFFDVHNTDGLVRKSETVAKNGESWLVMFESNGKYEIRRSTVKVTQLRTVSYPGDENDARVRFPGKGKAIFAFRNIKNLKIGPVETSYLRPTTDEIVRRDLQIKAMETGFERDFGLNDKRYYTLRVSTGQTTDGEKIGVLVLETDGIKQVIARNYYDSTYGTIIGELLWAGDIDGDGKLDLYFDEFNEKGYFAGGLYLSSHADEGELVKLVAMFGYAGC